MRRSGTLAAAALLVAALPATSSDAPPDVAPRIAAVIVPLAHVPSIQTVAEPLAVELAATTSLEPGDEVHVELVPSFGEVRPVRAVGSQRFETDDLGPSRLWPGRDALRFAFELPDDLDPGLYDLHATWTSADPLTAVRGEDLQRRAVSIVEGYPEAPRVVVIADPSVGDPRPVQEGAEEFLAGDTDDLAYRTTRTVGNPMDEDRWAALNRVVDEINLVRPDLVLISGDLTFAVHPRAMPYEYEDAWRILDRLEVPSFAAPGNHDLYDLDYLRAESGLYDEHVSDGKVEWQRYFGPLYYSADVGPELHLVSLDSFDWDDTRPFPPPDFDTLSGGRIGEEQLAWLEEDLADYRQRAPDGAVLTLAHHDPSWLARRHPWPERDNRDLVRELFFEREVWVHFAGHTHEDRIARYHNPDGEPVGSIVETNGRQHLADEYPLRELHYLDWSEGDRDPGRYSQVELAAILREPENGPLFVTTTTAASGLIGEDWGLGGYWGWRLADLIPQSETGGYDPRDFGYAVDAPTDDVAAFLEAAAERPEHWNPAHAALGVLSYPSHHLDLEVTGERSGIAVATVTSGLLDDLTVTIRLAVATGDGDVEVSGGETIAVRAGGGLADVWVRTVVPARGTAQVTVQGDPR